MPEQEGIDRLLSHGLSGPVPTLSPDFERLVLRHVQTRRLSKPGILALAFYAAFALAISVWTMRHAGIGWNLIAASAVVPLIVVATVFRRDLAASVSS